MNRRGSRLSRRQFVRGAGAAGLGLLAACGRLPGQASPAKVHRIGWLDGGTPATRAPDLEVFRQTLRELGYAEGQNLTIEYRWGEGQDDLLVEPAVELARLPLDVIVVVSTTLARFARAATSTIPIVQFGVGDLVTAGLAASYARPGGNVTGVTDLSTELSGKRLQLLKQAVPTVSRVAVFLNRELADGAAARGELERAAQLVGVKLHPIDLRAPEELDAAFDAAMRDGVDALFVTSGPVVFTYRQRIVDLAVQHRLPGIYYRRELVDLGGLMAYVANRGDLARRAAGLVDKILKGASPAELPIEQPMRFDFVVNLKTARELGITFPNEIMLQVTEVLQ
jgi:putative tryptophan/tyrosine transport system substrate-binding protein